MIKRARVYIKGDVVGVGFRAWTKIKAKELGITGWVRNVYDRPDIFGVNGGVEAVIQGQEDNVNKMIETLKKGPPVAIVSDVEVLWEKPSEVFEEFKIIR